LISKRKEISDVEGCINGGLGINEGENIRGVYWGRRLHLYIAQ